MSKSAFDKVRELEQELFYAMSCQGLLIKLNSELLEMLEKTRGQWIHSVHAEECLGAIAKAKGLDQ